MLTTHPRCAGLSVLGVFRFPLLRFESKSKTFDGIPKLTDPSIRRLRHKVQVESGTDPPSPTPFDTN